VAKDSSGSGNDLPLVSPPLRRDVTIQQVRRLAPHNPYISSAVALMKVVRRHEFSGR
jgi:hypothetical protein